MTSADPPSSVGAYLEESAEDLYENAPCGYLSAAPDGVIVKVNQTLLQWTGFSRTDLIGSRFQDLLTGGGRIYHETHYAPLLRLQGAVHEIALEIVCADGRRLPVLINSVMVTDTSGRPVVTRTTLFDATDRRRYEEELLRAREEAERAAARARLLAETLQSSFIPPAPPEVPGLDVAAVYRPAGDGTLVGGDFYDVFETARGDWAVVLGDVCGKGPEAAIVTALARHTIRATAMRSRRPARVLSLLNEALLRHETDRFATAVYARLRPVDGRCRINVSSAGHPLPLRVGADGTVEELGRPGGLLGVLATPAQYDTAAELHPGEVVVFYSDGVTEARSGNDFYGDERLQRLVRDLRAQDAVDIAARLLEDVMGFQSGVGKDDIAIVVVKMPGKEMATGQ